MKSAKTKEAEAVIGGEGEISRYSFTKGPDPFWDDNLSIEP